MTKAIQFTGLLIAVAVVGFVTVWFFSGAKSADASISYGNEYNATTTSATFSTQSEILIKTGQGALGSLIQTAAGAAGGNIDLYNATTSNVNLRTGRTATTSILIASLPTAAAAGTYVFDASFTTGLLMVKTGTVGTTTITSR